MDLNKKSPDEVSEESFLACYLLEFLHWCFIASYLVNNTHIVGYYECVIAYRLIFLVLSHKMLHQICTNIQSLIIL